MSRETPAFGALPTPSPSALAHSAEVVRHVTAAIEARGGWLPFDAYMDAVLYAPGLGYYVAGARKFGEAGDFVTAPELTPLFGATLARAVDASVAAFAPTTPWSVMEFGGGTGSLAAALLTTLASMDRLPARYLMLEVSPELKARQRERLAHVPGGERVAWIDALPDAPFTGVMLANEILDAFPVSRVRVRSGATVREVEELGVVVGAAQGGEDDGLTLAWRPADEPLVAAVDALEARLGRPLGGERGDHYCTELAPQREAWLATVAPLLESGAMLFVDYGVGAPEYYREERRDGTLLCHYRHRAHDDPLLHPGLQDITAWVEFSAIARCAQALGLTVAGFTHQAGFLLGNGFDQLATEALTQAGDGPERVAVASACRQLLLPGAMGERFRVLALTRGPGVHVPGLSAPDLLRTL